MTVSNPLAGKTALVTGASRGIGAQIAREFAARGADLIICARNGDALATTASACRESGANVFSATVDLSERESIDHFFRSIADRNLAIDCLVNNAAILIKNQMADYPLPDFELMMQVNVIAPLQLCQLAIPYLKRNSGTIVNISSLSGCVGVPKFKGLGAYNISKYSIWGLTEILALELAQDSIRVNQVSFAGVDTDMFRYAVGADARAPLTIEDAARHVVYLASPESAPLTGENIILAGVPLSR